MAFITEKNVCLFLSSYTRGGLFPPEFPVHNRHDEQVEQRGGEQAAKNDQSYGIFDLLTRPIAPDDDGEKRQGRRI